jgi:2-dehydro-3-deoxyphosphogluconate aldolase/(4S)-4-hydroxy-2-oxoglutarate aldolase
MIAQHSVGRLLEETGVVAVIRANEVTDLVALGRALGAGGVRLVEITMTVPNALDLIRMASQELGDEVLIGAGTVLDPTTARLAILAGAAFVVAPTFDAGIVEMCHLYGRAVIPGALTPTEIITAWRSGVDAVKVFPGRVATPGYFADVLAPLSHVRLIPTGNVDLATAPEYIAAGAVAVGVGKALVDLSAVRAGDLGTITENARRFRDVVDRARARGA